MGKRRPEQNRNRAHVASVQAGRTHHFQHNLDAICGCELTKTMKTVEQYSEKLVTARVPIIYFEHPHPKAVIAQEV